MSEPPPAALLVLNGEPLDRWLRFEASVLRDLLGLAAHELEFIDLPSTREVLEVIHSRLASAGITPLHPVRRMS